MILNPPFLISDRLMCAVTIGKATVSLALSNGRTADGRTRFDVWIDLPDGAAYHDTSMRSGCQGGSIAEGFASLFNFLSAAVESRQYRERHLRQPYDPTEDDSNESLFPPHVINWAEDCEDEISMLAIELQERPTEYISE